MGVGGRGRGQRAGQGFRRPVVSISLAAVRKASLVVLAALLLAYLVSSGLYLRSFRLRRTPDTIVISASTAVRADVQRLSRAFTAETGIGVVLVDPPRGEGSMADLLSSGATDCALAEVGSLEPAPGGVQGGSGGGDGPIAKVVTAPGAPPLYLPTLLSVRFPSPQVAVSLEEARAIRDDLAAGGAGPWSGAGLEAIGLADRSPGRQLLAVEGVYPTLDTVVSGAYPLSSEMRLHIRCGPAGFLGLPGRIPSIRGWLQPNEVALREFGAWLGTAGARTALYGTAEELTLTAVGDIWFARNVGKMIDENGLDYPFAHVAEHLRAADITWCDLESPMGVTGTPLPGKLIWFRSKPETVQCLKPPGIDIVALANNHILDYDSPCLIETLDALDANHIAYCGAGRDETEARRPAVLEANGLKVAFLAYTEYADSSLHWSYDYPRTFLAGEGVPGCNPLYLDIVAEDIARARKVADLVVVGYHWGRENEPYPTPYHPWNNLPDIARKTIDLGACLVLGTHPHYVQGYEVRGNGLIAYSLGNFVTDQIEDTQREGMILDVQLGPSGVLSARITPVWSEGFRPQVMEVDQAQALLEEVERISRAYGQRD